MRFALPNRRRPSGPLLLELDLSRGVVETPSATPLRLVGARPAPALHALLTALRQAELDRHVAGLVAHVAQRSISLALSSELRDAVGRFRRSGKVAVAWTESFGELGVGNVGYHLATAFEEIWLQPSGLATITVGSVYFWALFGTWAWLMTLHVERGRADSEPERATAPRELQVARSVASMPSVTGT